MRECGRDRVLADNRMKEIQWYETAKWCTKNGGRRTNGETKNKTKTTQLDRAIQSEEYNNTEMKTNNKDSQTINNS